jgi:hypothetical protein
MSAVYSLKTPRASNRRHWCPRSEKFTGVDSLLSAISDGWTINHSVLHHQVWRGGTRPVDVYFFELIRGRHIVTMPVISNPWLERVIVEYELQIHTYSNQEVAQH